MCHVTRDTERMSCPPDDIRRSAPRWRSMVTRAEGAAVRTAEVVC